jgi:hypothetical protein
VASCHEGSATIKGLVDWTVVVRVLLGIFLEARLEPDHGALDVEDLRITLINYASLPVPLAALNIETTDIDTVIRGRRIVVLDNIEIKDKLIDSDSIFTSEVLDGSSQETLREIELIDPEERWDTLINPILEEL